MRFWRPAVQTHTHHKVPQPGSLIAVTGKPWVVIEVLQDTHQVEIVVHKPGKPGHHYGIKAQRLSQIPWHLLPEHYAICATCGDLAPCRTHLAEGAALQAAQELEKHLAILPGMCPACGEPVTSRQNSITFGGPNLLNPLLDDGVVFHLRAQCRDMARSYENRWIKEDPRNQRSLLTIACEGTRIVHQDGTAECDGTEHSPCPTVFANHTIICACYTNPHGCPKGCTPQGHPGTQMSGYPKNPRDYKQRNPKLGN